MKKTSSLKQGQQYVLVLLLVRITHDLTIIESIMKSVLVDAV
jgi:hypothetical protein